jgi:hypothetical protein
LVRASGVGAVKDDLLSRSSGMVWEGRWVVIVDNVMFVLSNAWRVGEGGYG